MLDLYIENLEDKREVLLRLRRHHCMSLAAFEEILVIAILVRMPERVVPWSLVGCAPKYQGPE